MTDTETRPCLSDLTAEEIAEETCLKPFQGRQIYRWIHFKQVFDFNAMTNLSKENRERLSSDYTIGQLKLVNLSASEFTDTKKALLALKDGETVETVLIPSRKRLTICLSTQVGCAVKCSFCATGMSGFTRNLSPGEIVEQALYLLQDTPLEGRTPNIVFMGMGEPFRNYDATTKAVRMLMSKDGLNIGARKITISTAGEVTGIDRFTAEDWQVRLSVSLHAANDALRDKLVPLNKRYPIKKLMDAVDNYVESTGRQMTFEWALLGGINDSDKDARELAELAAPLKAHVNLIPYNPVAGLGYTAPDPGKCRRFRDELESRDISVTLRQERGQDIDAACGQLRRRTIEGNAPA